MIADVIKTMRQSDNKGVKILSELIDLNNIRLVSEPEYQILIYVIDQPVEIHSGKSVFTTMGELR